MKSSSRMRRLSGFLLFYRPHIKYIDPMNPIQKVPPFMHKKLLRCIRSVQHKCMCNLIWNFLPKFFNFKLKAELWLLWEYFVKLEWYVSNFQSKVPHWATQIECILRKELFTWIFNKFLILKIWNLKERSILNFQI